MSTPRTQFPSDAAVQQIQAAAEFAADVHYYLQQVPRQLPSRYLYDPLGSALFDAICRLPWYRITRSEERLLGQHARSIVGRARPLSTIVEMGSGSGEKLRTLIDAGDAATFGIEIHLVDLSRSALETSIRTLATFEHLRMTAHQARYEEGLKEATERLPLGGRALVLFLGSNIGNFDPPGAAAFLRGVRDRLRPGDSILLGADLVKPQRELLLAYDDPLGVTAAFNRNLLIRINRDLCGDFDAAAFRHCAVWNEAESRVEMHLVCCGEQHVRIAGAGIDFVMHDGEAIWTESSYKYEPEAINTLLETAGFRVTGQWIDDDDRFALTLSEAN